MSSLLLSRLVSSRLLDACQHGYIPYVVKEAVGDRHISIHESNLFDLQAKYAEVSTKVNVIEELKKLYLGKPISVPSKSLLLLEANSSQVTEEVTNSGGVDKEGNQSQEEMIFINDSTFEIEEVTITKLLKEEN